MCVWGVCVWGVGPYKNADTRLQIYDAMVKNTDNTHILDNAPVFEEGNTSLCTGSL